MIRRLTAQDEAAWRALWAGYNQFYQREVPDDVTDTLWASLVAGDGQPWGYVWDEGDGPVGFTHYWFQRSSAERGERIYLQDLFVLPETRGKSVGRALIEAVYAESDARGNGGVFWLTQEGNATGRRLYDRVARVTDFIKYQR